MTQEDHHLKLTFTEEYNKFLASFGFKEDHGKSR